LPFRIRDKWATIGDDNRPWHVHLNMDEVVEARFVKEPRSDARDKVIAYVSSIQQGACQCVLILQNCMMITGS
jgi:hypothetical protein